MAFLVRFDDLCPTMNWDIWERVEDVLIRNSVTPILAIVPDNQDPRLDVAPAQPAFWSRVREWQGRDWTIGLHGYQHLYLTRSAGIVGTRPLSEFAGVPPAVQHAKLSAALELFKAQGIVPDVWVAPGHTFDANTLGILHTLGLGVVSDGHSVWPHRDNEGLIWIPQQIWRFRPLPLGVWTVCFHHNQWTNADLQAFEANIRHFRSQLSSVAEIIAVYGSRRRNFVDAAAESLIPHVLRLRQRIRAAGPGGKTSKVVAQS
jgi:predicted deacetylase